MKIAVFSAKSYDREYFNRFNTKSSHSLTYFEAPLNNDTANLTNGYDAVCVFVNDKVDKDTIEQLAENKIKAIVLRCSGFNNINLETAAKFNIRVLRVPAYSPEAVAEHAVALILTLNRKTHKAYNRIREGNFSLEKLMGFNIHGKTVGVIGTGRIGVKFCEIMLGFGCKVIASDFTESDFLKQKGVTYQSLDMIFKNADIISLHCPLTPETNHLIDKDAFAKMKKGVMLINTSRGALINAKDAIIALKNGTLGYLGIDVYEQEEHLFYKDLSEVIIQDEVISRLMTFPNVLITSHQGFFTREALEQISIVTLKNLDDVAHGTESLNEVK